MWADGIFGNEVIPGGTVFENRAHMTTAKAMLINTAYQYPFTGTGHDKTRMHQGWGMPDVGRLYDLRENIYVIDETVILEPFDVEQHIVAVEAGEPALKVTMTYADPPGNPAVQTQHRINDLTLKVISPTGVVYYGNNGLLDGVWSTPDGDPDTKNTVECVFVENPESGAWIVEVHADEIIQDSHIETPELDADYALVASPVIVIPGQNLPPNDPSNPQPWNGQTDVDPDADLFWTCSDPNADPLTYDVIFEAGDPTPDTVVSLDQTETTYDPGTLEAGVTYYWKIIAEDPDGLETEGPIWSFTVFSNSPPTMPSNPYPEDGATDIDVGVTLSWSCVDPDGDPITFDVYLEANDQMPDVLVSRNQTELSYTHSIPLEYNTHYWWRIIAWDSNGASTNGPAWDFFTGDESNNPPEQPDNPSPINGATGVSVEADLSWTCSDPDGNDLTYDVYFEVDDPEPDVLVSDDQTETNYDPGTLSNSSIYYWQIIAKDEHGATTEGPVWQFTTEGEANHPPGALTIDGPTSGKPGITYDYNFTNCVDPDGDDMTYHVEWGDGGIDEGFVESGGAFTLSHIWSEEGDYTIKAKLIDIYGAESDWATLEVVMPVNQQVINPLLQMILERFPMLERILFLFPVFNRILNMD